MSAYPKPELEPYPYEYFKTVPRLGYESLVDDRFMVGSRIGSGGQASVYSAADVESGELTALKFAAIPKDEHWARWQREVDITRALTASSANIVGHVSDGVYESRGLTMPYMSLEYMSGGSMADRIRLSKNGKLAPGELLRIVTPAFRGVEVCNEADLVHRDVKPSNILIDGFGLGKISDFGVVGRNGDSFDPESAEKYDISPDIVGSQLTVKDSPIGTIANIAPEVLLQDEDYTPAVDVYGAGITLHYGLNGTHPVGGRCTSMYNQRSMLMEFDPSMIRLSQEFVSQQIGRLARACMEKEPEKRPTMREVISTLEVLQEHADIPGERNGYFTRELKSPEGYDEVGGETTVISGTHAG